MSNQQKMMSIRDTVRQLAPPQSKAILYGSRARGDARSDSDWDIDRARHHLSQADEMLSLGQWDMAANRQYYACYPIS